MAEITLDEAKKEAASLRTQLNEWADDYYSKDAPEVEDNVYDQSYNRLLELEKLYPQIVTPDSITQDYDGIMGVPITFLDKFNPDQFEIIGYTAKNLGVKCLKFYQNMAQSNKNSEFVHNTKSARFSPMILHKNKPNKTCYIADNANGYLTKCYGRIVIRNKHPEDYQNN